jgi:hypothetical protein
MKSTLLVRAGGALLLLTLVLVLLKQAGLTPVAHWSWWAITSPLWGPWAVSAVLAGLTLAWVLLVAALRKAARA